MHLKYFKYFQDARVLTAGNHVRQCAPLAATAARDHFTAAPFKHRSLL